MANQIPENLKYTKDHDWALIDGDTITIGVSDYAQSALGDIVYVELPEIGRTLEQNETYGVVESVKTVSDLHSPISGNVISVNNELEDQPDLCNSNPYDSWIVKIKSTNEEELKNLLSPADYKNHIEIL